jgi:inorganic pyrophosphatase
MPNLIHLPSYTKSGALRVVVETPGRSAVKIRYDPSEEIFEFSRPLVLGVVYPYDWGFIPSTLAPDGDPLDAMVYHDGTAYPGVVIACRPVGLVRLSEKGEDGSREENDRVIAVPEKDDRCRDARDLNRRVRGELEEFFQSATLMEGKDVKVKGWSGPKAAARLIGKAQKAYRRGL